MQQVKDRLGANPNAKRRRGLAMTEKQVEELRARQITKRKAGKQSPKRV